MTGPAASIAEANIACTGTQGPQVRQDRQAGQRPGIGTSQVLELLSRGRAQGEANTGGRQQRHISQVPSLTAGAPNAPDRNWKGRCPTFSDAMATQWPPIGPKTQNQGFPRDR